MYERVIVVVEDDPSIGGLLEMYLHRAGFRALVAPSGERGLELIDRHRPVLVIIDVGLPGIDGFELCRRLRSRPGSAGDVPVLFLTARGAESDRLSGFALGADDYVVKPFSARELVARVSAIVARTGHVRRDGVVRFDGIEVDEPRREVRVDGVAVALTMREFDLLAHLACNRSLALSRRQLVDAVWGDAWAGDERTVDVHVGQLRKKLGPRLPLATVWGIGYRLG